MGTCAEKGHRLVKKKKVSFLFHDGTFTRRKKDLLFEKKVHSLCNSSVEKDSQ